MVNLTTRPIAQCIAVVNCNLPRHIVANQLMIFTPVGTAMNIVVAEKTATEIGPMPEANMWWAQTPQPMKPMATPENTTNGYPKSGFFEKTGSTSDTMPKLGKI